MKGSGSRVKAQVAELARCLAIGVNFGNHLLPGVAALSKGRPMPLVGFGESGFLSEVRSPPGNQSLHS